MSTKKYTLRHAVGSITELALREHAIAADFLAFDERGGVAQRIALIASVSGTDKALIEKLHGVDYLSLERYVDALLRAAEVDAFGPEPQAELSEAQKK